MKTLLSLIAVAGLGAYLVAFYATTLPSALDANGDPISRFELVRQVILLPDVLLTPNWFGMPPEFALADRGPVLLVAGVILAWAAALGWLVVGGRGRIADAGLTRLETLVFAVAIGLNLLSTWVLLLGLCGAMNWWTMFALPAAVTLLASAGAWRSRKQAATPTRANAIGPVAAIRPISTRWLWLAAPFVAAILLGGMLPPLDFDVREYHLQAPKEFFQQGQITFVPHNVYANMAMGTEMLSLLAMVISGDWWLGALAGKTVLAAMTPLTALALLAAGRRFFSPTAGVVAALLYISIPWIVSIAAGGLVEGASAFYLLLAVYALLLWSRFRSNATTAYLGLAGYMAGAAVATKYPAALFVLAPLTAWVTFRAVSMVRSTHPTLLARFRRMAFALVVFLLAAAVGCGLWFGKNWALCGNPTYPLLYSVFDGKTWTPDKERQWNRVHRPADFPLKTLGNDLERVVLTSEWLSPLVVPLAALALLATIPWGLSGFSRGLSRFSRRERGGDPRTPNRRENGTVPLSVKIAWGLLAYIGFVIAVWWLLTHRIDRFWIPVLPLMALLAGAGACWSPARWWRRLLIGLLIVCLGTNFLVASMGRGNAWFVSLDRLRTAPDRIGPWHCYLNSRFFRGKLLTVGDAAVFDLETPVLYNTCFDDCLFEQWVKGKSPAEVRAALAAHDVSLIYVDWGEIDRYRHSGYGFTDFVQPEVFDRLVADGILSPLPPIKDQPGRAYLVSGKP